MILSVISISIISYCQPNKYSGKNTGGASLFDSGRVSLRVKEYNYDTCGTTKRPIYECKFILKNDNSYSVILKRYDFYSYNYTDSINRVGCTIASVSMSKNADTLAPNSEKVVDIFGEYPGHYQPRGTEVNTGCPYHWEFDGFTPYKK